MLHGSGTEKLLTASHAVVGAIVYHLRAMYVECELNKTSYEGIGVNIACL